MDATAKHADAPSPRRAHMRLLDAGIIAGIGFLIALLLVIAALNYRNTYQLNEDSAWVAHTHEVLDLTSNVLRTLVDAETGVRGFVITGNEVSLQPYDAALKRKDGSTFPLHLAVSNAFRSGDKREFSGIVRDLTQHKRLEQEIRDRNDELTAANRTKDEFLATLSHELRNPLAPLRQALEIMKRSEGNAATTHEALGIAERQVVQLARLVDDLLDVSRITRNKLELRIEPIDLASVVANAVETVRPLIEQRGHDLTVVTPARPVHVDADPVRLAQALSNLLNNVAKYTAPGGSVTLTAQGPGNEAIVSVKDNGIGIPAEMLSKVFDLFTQIEQPQALSRDGLGIGLTLVKRLVEMHGGSVEARSEGSGCGSEFVVRLPAVATPAHAQPATQTALPASAVRRRILIVDDNRDAAASLAMVLKQTGHDVQTVLDGAAAGAGSRVVSTASDAARHRAAEDGRLRGLPPHARAASRQAHGAGRAHRLGTGRGQAPLARFAASSAAGPACESVSVDGPARPLSRPRTAHGGRGRRGCA